MNDQTVDQLPSNTVLAARTLVGFWLAGWFLKGFFFKEYLFTTIIQYPFLIDFFPPFFRSPVVAQFFYVLPLLIVPVFIRRQKF